MGDEDKFSQFIFIWFDLKKILCNVLSYISPINVSAAACSHMLRAVAPYNSGAFVFF